MASSLKRQALRPLAFHQSLFKLPPSARTSILIHLNTLSRRSYASQTTPAASDFVPAPKEDSGPLLTRLPNRALPVITSSRGLWLRTLPIFVFLITISSLAIFNYQKSSSSTVNSILYALRTNETARELLGDEVYFASKVPWISGELNQLHGVIDISFEVKGTKGQGRTQFRSVRKRRDGFFETVEWSLKMADGREVRLLEGEGAQDPMATKRQGTT